MIRDLCVCVVFAATLGVVLGCTGTSRIEPAEAAWGRKTVKELADGSVITVWETSSARGAGLQGEGLDKIKVEQPTAGPGGGEAGGAELKWYDVTAIKEFAKSSRALYFIGAGVILAGLALGKLLGWIFALVCGLAGGAIIGAGVVADRYPWAYLLGLGAAAVLLAGYLLYRAFRAERQGTALRVMTNAIKLTPKDARDQVKERIEAAAGTSPALTRAVAREVHEAKRRSGAA